MLARETTISLDVGGEGREARLGKCSAATIRRQLQQNNGKFQTVMI